MYTVNHELLRTLKVPEDTLEGEIALVTGGARGIGEGTAMTLAELGTKVVIIDILPTGQAVADAIKKNGGEATFIQGDLSDLDQLNTMIPDAVAAYGRVDILINNALYFKVAPIITLGLDEWEKTFNTNARAPFLLTQNLLPGMLERKHGVIVNMIAYEGGPMGAAYAGTKMTIRSLSLSLARELGTESGVSSYSFVPGIVDTPLIKDVIVPQFAEVMGVPEEQVVTAIAQNPGYEQYVPVEHCVSALVYSIVHAKEYHGQVADPFEPLDRHNVIDLPVIDTSADPDKIDVSDIMSGSYLKHYLNKVTSLNSELEQRIEVRTRELREAQERSESLLLNILPPPIADRLKQGENMIADHFDEATVLFADIVDFTPMSEKLEPQKVVEILDRIFTAFDGIAGRYELEKIKTIGDCYMMVGGIPEHQSDHAARVAKAALEMVPTLDDLGKELGLKLTTRIGLHTGSVIAGVIGQQKFIYDLWGDTVNVASRMESHGISSRIQCTEEVYRLLNSNYAFEPRGEIDVKGKGMMHTYFLMGNK